MRILLLFLCLVLVPGVAQAHTKSQSFSSWSFQEEDIVMVFQVDTRRVTLLQALDETTRLPAELLSLHLLETVEVTQAGTPCVLAGVPRPLRAAEGYERLELRFRCAESATWRDVDVAIGAFFPVSAQHIHFARARDGEGGWREIIYSDTSREHSFGEAIGEGHQIPQGPAFLVYTGLGVQHILEGLDHLAFVAALLLLSRNFRQVLYLITGFTVGHSITLALAALGVISPNVPVIEALIGFTIAFVAAEVLAGRQTAFWQVSLAASGFLGVLVCFSFLRDDGVSWLVWFGLLVFVLCYGALTRDGTPRAWLSPVLTVGFGLIHGAGFANVLAEIGLPSDRLVWALLGFNIGVEIGQILVVVLLAAAWYVGGRLLSVQRLAFASQLSATLLLALGTFWFVDRAF